MKKLNLAVVTKADTLHSITVKLGDWSGYLRSVADFRSQMPMESMQAHPSLDGNYYLNHEWSISFAQFQRTKLREYLGTRIRGFSREPKTLTPVFLLELARINLEARAKREPYFVEIARLYARIQELEWELDSK